MSGLTWSATSATARRAVKRCGPCSPRSHEQLTSGPRFDHNSDGRALAESGAILFHFAEGTEYLPSDSFERAQVLQWMFFEQYDVEPNIAVVRFWTLGEASVDAALREPKVAAGHRALAALQRHLSHHRFLVGERYCIADIALYGYVHVAPEGGFALDGYPAVQAWLARVAAHPGHVTIDA